MQHLAHPASVDAYIRNGWSLVPIPPGTKGPNTKGWNRRENSLASHLSLPSGYGIGLAHAYSGTMALDIDEWDRAAFELMLKGINLQALYDAPDAVIVDSGRAGRGKLLYSMPFGLALPSKKLTVDNITYMELRCGTTNGLTTQDVLPPSIHPVTNQPYRWAGKGHWSRLPQIPQTLLDLWLSMIDLGQEEPSLPSWLLPPVQISDTWDEVRRMLAHINPDCPRKDWIAVGMAIHLMESQMVTKGEAFPIWDTWSATGYKYPGKRALETQWDSFRSDKDTTITLGTLKHLARAGGWTPPAPDVGELFQSLPTPGTPDEILNLFTPPPPKCNPDPFPTILRQRAEEVSVSIGCDPLIPLLAGLGAVCAAVDSRTRLSLADGWKVPPVLWLMTIGEPAGKKSPGSTPMFKILEDLEREDRPNYNQKHMQWQGADAAYAAAMKSFRDYCSSPEYILNGDGAPAVPDRPAEPQPLRIAITDITSQDMVRKAAARPYGMLMYRDELAAWFAQLTDSKSGVDRSAWTVSYEARPYHMDRVGSGHIYAENLAISVYGNIQPDALAIHMKRLTEDGFLQRFIPGVLPRSKWKRGRAIPDHLTNRGQWENMIRVAHALPIMDYSLSDGAAKVFYDFQTWFGQQLDDAQLMELPSAYRTALGKCDGTLGRLALVFHVMESPFNIQVSEDTMARAAEFMTNYVVPSLYYTMGQLGGSCELEKWVTEHVMQRSDQGVVTLADMRSRLAGNNIGKDVPPWKLEHHILTAMYTIENSGWAIRVDEGKHTQWAIAPLHKRFPEYRAAVIDAQQRLQDQIWSKSGRAAPRVYGAG